MFRSADRSPRRRNRAVTLIEAVLYIAIALALIVGGLVFFQQASNAAKTSAMVRQFSAILAEARAQIKGVPITPGTPFYLNNFMIAAGAVPPDMVTSETDPWAGQLLSNPFGGRTQIIGLNSFNVGATIQILSSNIPKGVCARLLTASSGSHSDWTFNNVGATTMVSSGYWLGGAAPSGDLPTVKPYGMNATQAGWMCKYGGSNYPVKTVEPTSAPISGNVSVSMVFMVER
jgi:type II secretory pathway pseudopilin PulG